MNLRQKKLFVMEAQLTNYLPFENAIIAFVN